MHTFAVFIIVSSFSFGASFEGLKCKWRQFLVFDSQYLCPDGYLECAGSAELALACKAYTPKIKVCCQKQQQTTSISISPTATTSTTEAVVSTTTESDSSSLISFNDFAGFGLQAGMCGIYPPWEANHPPCLAAAFTDSENENSTEYFVVPVPAKFESATCVCEAWGGRLAVSPLEPSAVLRLLSACTDGMAWIDAKGDACVAVYSQPVPKVGWVACESFLPVLCQF